MICPSLCARCRSARDISIGEYAKEVEEVLGGLTGHQATRFVAMLYVGRNDEVSA